MPHDAGGNASCKHTYAYTHASIVHIPIQVQQLGVLLALYCIAWANGQWDESGSFAFAFGA